ncbi:MAG: hypothetical protein V1774_04160 [Candidatus Eisenbacteria bacterium]
MLIYAGIDEAGYGPILGPLVVARSVFLVEAADPRAPLPSLWTLQRGAVCRRAGDGLQRVAINDSKLLYNATLGLRHLERGVLGFLYAAAIRPRSLNELFASLAHDAASQEMTLAWYREPSGGPRLPSCVEQVELERVATRVVRAWSDSGLRLAEVKAAIVFEDRFNRMVGDCQSKAACSWCFVAEHLQSIWENYGELHPRVIVDRQGGRRNYLELLAALFPWTRLRLIECRPAVSSYEVSDERRSMEIAVHVASERDHLPAAFASMTAKYLRELLMARFRAYWQQQAPAVRGSSGYAADGQRFLREIQPTLARLGIDPRMLIRVR